MIHTVTAYAFLRSQKPELKTDYRNFIESPECPPEITTAFERIHEILHQRFPKRPVRLSFPLETDSGVYLCQCYCGEVRSPEGRPFLALCGIAARVSELKFLGINPVALFFAADFTAVVAEEKAIIQRDVSAAPNFGVQADRNLRAEFAARLSGGISGTIPWPAGADIHTVLCSLFYAYQDIPTDTWYESAFALELSPDTPLPLTFPVTLAPQGNVQERVAEPTRTTQKAAVPSAEPADIAAPPPAPARPATSRTGRQRLQALEKLADALHQQRGADDFWRYRLWHYCQDVITAAEHCLEADDNHDADTAQRHLSLVLSRRERLEQEIGRAFTTPDLRPVANDLKRDLREWYENTFVPSLHLTQSGKGPIRASAGEERVDVIPRPQSILARLPAWVWTLVAFGFLSVVVGLLLAQSRGQSTPSASPARLGSR